MDLSDLRGLDAVITAVLAALGGRQLHEAFKTRARAQELDRVRERMHILNDKIQAEVLLRAVLESQLKQHVDVDEDMHRRVEHWMESIEQKIDRLIERRGGV